MSGKILIVDNLATRRIKLKAQLGQACYGIVQAVDGASALHLARQEAPDLVLLDAGLPDMTCADLCARLRSDPARRLPVVILGAANCADARLQALKAGADDYLAWPVEDALLLARLRSLIRAAETEAELQLRDETCRALGFVEPPPEVLGTARISLVGPTLGVGVRWRDAFAGCQGAKVDLLSRAEALAVGVTRPAPDAFVLSVGALRTKGIGRSDCLGPARDMGRSRAMEAAVATLDLMSELRTRTVARHAAMLVALPPGASALAAMALDLGAGDVVACDAPPAEITLRLRRLIARKRRHDRLRASVHRGLQLAMIDPLTGLFNRRYALPHLSRIAERAQVSGKRFAVMVLDLDRFKQVNDTWGHAAGDAVLVEVAARLMQNLRAEDLLARIGGEEFLVAVPDAGPDAARQLAERLCRMVEATPITLPCGADVSITLSIGLAVAQWDRPGGTDPLALLERADHALLAAKAEGRNQVTTDRPAA